MSYRPVAGRQLTVVLAAAFLSVPAAAPAAALTGTVDDALNETEKVVSGVTNTGGDSADDAGGASEAASPVERATAPVDDATRSVKDTVSGASEAVDATVEGAGETADRAVKGVGETVDHAASGDASGAADAATDTVTDAVDNVGRTVGNATQEATGGGAQPPQADPSPPPEPEPLGGPGREVAGAPTVTPDGTFSDRTVSRTQPISSLNTSDPRAFRPPATNGAFDAVANSDDDVTTASNPDVGGLTPLPDRGADGPSPAAVPGLLVGIAAGLLALVGAGHVVHGARRLTAG